LSQAFHGGNLASAAQRFGRDPDDFVDFSSNLNIWLKPILPVGEEILREMMRYPEVDARHLRSRLADLYRVNSAHILPTAGGAEALYLAARLFSGKRVGIIEPAFGDYSRACRSAGIASTPILLSPEEWFFPLSALRGRLEEFDVIMLGNPNNPTGHLHSRTALIETMRCFPEKSWIVDEAFVEFVEFHEQETLLAVPAEFRSLIVVGSLTKSGRVPGLRLGFLAASRGEWLEKISLWQPPWSINGVAQLWARHNLTPSGWDRMEKSLADLPRLRCRFIAELESLPDLRVQPGRANFLLVELLNGGAAELYDALGRQGMIVRICDSFTGMIPDRYVRIAIRNEDENRRLVQAIARYFESALQPA
jgi:histidinol-phosphate/aromatic aminotransferase/cobyric acid decarboxylase-like protein